MKTALLVAASLMAVTTSASAGTYLGLALGTEPGINDALGESATPHGRSLRALGGIRIARLSIEAALNTFGVATGFGDKDVYQLSASGKLNLPLSDGFEVFGRGGLERTWLNVGDDRYNLAGNGFLVGAGFEYRLDLGVTSASIFVDYTIHRATLEDTRHDLDATSRIWGLGFTVGI